MNSLPIDDDDGHVRKGTPASAVTGTRAWSPQTFMRVLCEFNPRQQSTGILTLESELVLHLS